MMNTLLMLTFTGLLGVVIGYRSCIARLSSELTAKSKESNLLKTQLQLISKDKALTFSDRLNLFEMKEYRKYHLLLNKRDVDYLVCQYLKEHEILPYTSVDGDIIYKYPKLRFVVDLKNCHFICNKNYMLDLDTDAYYRFKDFAKGTQFVLELSGGSHRKPKRGFLGEIKGEYKDVDSYLSSNILVFHEDLKVR